MSVPLTQACSVPSECHVCRADQFLNESFSFMLDVDEESLQKFAFHGAVFEMMRMAGVEDFGVKDIYSPEPGRTTLLLSAAISFHKHRSVRLSVHLHSRPFACVWLHRVSIVLGSWFQLCVQATSPGKTGSTGMPLLGRLQVPERGVILEGGNGEDQPHLRAAQ